MRNFATYLLLATLLLSLPAGAQKQTIRFDNLTIKDGLSQSSINDILQDQMGFIWVATQDGLNKYDGYDFQIYKQEANNPHSISNNYIKCLTQDNLGNMWVGTEAGGLNRFRPNDPPF